MNSRSQTEPVTWEDAVHRMHELLFIVRDTDLQQEALVDLDNLDRDVQTEKRAAIKVGDDDLANWHLGQECVIRWLQAELKLWINLKNGKADDAWDCLIDAQLAVASAIRAHRKFEKVAGVLDRLHMIERVCFPRQVFLSAGLVVGKQECTICNSDYEDCDHLVGRPYLGEFCFRHLIDVSADHVAIVEEPANKKCRITHTGEGRQRRNVLTGRFEMVDQQAAVAPNGMTASGVILDTRDLQS